MKISEDTLTILKNFAGIQLNLLIKPGNKLVTLSDKSNVMAVATIDDSFDQEVGIYDMNQFLGVISLFEKPSFEFGEKAVVISEGKRKTTYRYTAANMIKYPEKELNVPSPDLEFVLTKDDRLDLLKAAAVLGAKYLVLKGKGENGKLVVCDENTPHDYAADVEVKVNSVKEYNVTFSIENLKFLDGDYLVGVGSRVCVFTNVERAKKGKDLIYYVAPEAKNTKIA